MSSGSNRWHGNTIHIMKPPPAFTFGVGTTELTNWICICHYLHWTWILFESELFVDNSSQTPLITITKVPWSTIVLSTVSSKGVHTYLWYSPDTAGCKISPQFLFCTPIVPVQTPIIHITLPWVDSPVFTLTHKGSTDIGLDIYMISKYGGATYYCLYILPTHDFWHISVYICKLFITKLFLPVLFYLSQLMYTDERYSVGIDVFMSPSSVCVFSYLSKDFSFCNQCFYYSLYPFRLQLLILLNH